MRWEVLSALIGAVAIVLSASVSALAVMITQHRADERLDRVRQQDREAEVDRRRVELEEGERRRAAEQAANDLAYRRELEERWRDERREAHSHLLTQLERAWQGVGRYASAAESLEPDALPPRHVGEALVSDADMARLEESLSRVQLIGSPEAVKAANKAWQSVWMINLVAPGAILKAGAIVADRKKYFESMENYRTAARQELGVEGILPPGPETLPPVEDGGGSSG